MGAGVWENVSVSAKVIRSSLPKSPSSMQPAIGVPKLIESTAFLSVQKNRGLQITPPPSFGSGQKPEEISIAILTSIVAAFAAP